MEKAMIPGALAEALQKRREIMVVTVSPRAGQTVRLGRARVPGQVRRQHPWRPPPEDRCSGGGPRTNQRQPWPQLRESAPAVIAGHLEIASSADPLDADRIAACTSSVSPSPVNGPGESALNGIAVATERELPPLYPALGPADQAPPRHWLAAEMPIPAGAATRIRMLETTHSNSGRPGTNR
jgi:hypothetical protein